MTMIVEKTRYTRWLASLLVAACCVHSAVASVKADNEEGGEEEISPAYAVFFPPFTLTVGVIIYYLLSRFAKALPYTGVMFLIGTLMGIAVAVGDFSGHTALSIKKWFNINGEVLLLTFLPGLIFKDAMGQNVHLFVFALGQLMIFAFPMVLAGTTLTALVGYYVFPFGWSFDLAMTFGSILAATDPVAVAALLEEVGAPPRLKVHVAGESLLNDGSAIVFFFIFSQRFFYELGIDGFGQDVGWGAGIAWFFKKALGGFAIGLAFGLILLIILFALNRRFSREENVVQVTAVIAIAYLNFYVGDFVTQTSGVIATVTAGLVAKLLGRAMVNDLLLLEDFMALVEHLLNTVLFSLGGVVWGATIVDGERNGSWTGQEWAYLILLYILLTVIRAITFVAAYPITVRIGLKTNWKETLFQIYGGLRGAVGIALAIVLDSEVFHYVSGDEDHEQKIQTTQVFGMVGGIAFMTLAINGITAGPLLIKLGLADSTEARQKITGAYENRLRAATIDEMVRLLTFKRFHRVNFALVKHHVPYLGDLTKLQMLEAVEKHKETTANDEYHPPFLGGIWPYLADDGDGSTPSKQELDEILLEEDEHDKHLRRLERTKSRKSRRGRRVSSNLRFMLGEDCVFTALELRILFLSILRAVYEQQESSGELEDQHILAVSLEQSLDFAEDAVSNGEPLNDWEFLRNIHEPIANISRRMTSNTQIFFCRGSIFKHRSVLGLKASKDKMYIERSMAFMAGHTEAQKHFLSELGDVDSQISEAAKLVMQESREQVRKAEEVLGEFDHTVLEVTATHKFCKVLLNYGIAYMGKLVHTGLLKESEAEPYVEELEEYLHHTVGCHELHKPAELRKKPSLNPEDSSPGDYLTSDTGLQVLPENDEENRGSIPGDNVTSDPEPETNPDAAKPVGENGVSSPGDYLTSDPQPETSPDAEEGNEVKFAEGATIVEGGGFRMVQPSTEQAPAASSTAVDSTPTDPNAPGLTTAKSARGHSTGLVPLPAILPSLRDSTK